MTAKKFLNFSDKEFSWKWDGIEHTFPAGMTIFLEDYKADHFAKHLVDRELNRLGLQTSNVAAREKLTVQCFPTDEVITPLEALNRNEEIKIKEEKEEVEFEDLHKDEEDAKIPEIKEQIEEVKEEVEEEVEEKPKRGRPKKYE